MVSRHATEAALPHRRVPALFVAAFALIMQVWLGAAAPVWTAASLAGVICGSGEGHGPRPPEHRPDHGPSCTLCPAMAGAALDAPLLPDAAAPRPRQSHTRRLLASAELPAPALRWVSAGQPRAPPLS